MQEIMGSPPTNEKSPMNDAFQELEGAEGRPRHHSMLERPRALATAETAEEARKQRQEWRKN